MIYRQIIDAIFINHNENDCILLMRTIQYNFIDLRRRNLPLVRLRDRDAGWKWAVVQQAFIEQVTFQTTLNNIE